MRPEDKNKDYKSLRKAIGKHADLKSLAETCVCFANAQGGELVIGVEDEAKKPPADQELAIEEVNKVVKTLRGLTDGVGLVNPEIQTHQNGGQYFSIKVLPSQKVIATTSSGKVLIRVSDNCFPVENTEITRLAEEKSAFQWEIIAPQKIKIQKGDSAKINTFIDDIRASDKVSDFVKEQDTEQILSLYQLITPENYLTNLGVLWLGSSQQRARLTYPLTFQYIVYNEHEEKIRKKEWHFHLHNPKELIEEIEREAIELTYSTELPNGLFRETIRQYPKEVIRELIVNAVAHRKYTISGDIFIEVYPNKMTITNPGSLPLGVTKDNILHKRHRRNPHLITILSDLKLMEGEGSGFDLIYEKLVRDAKPLPEIESDFSGVSVTVYSGTINNEVVSILDYVDRHFKLTQKEYVTLGIIATEKKILSTELSEKLQLGQEEKIKSWMGTLLDKKVVVTRGQRKGTSYLLNPDLFSQAKLDIKPSLKTMEPHALEELIKEDIKINGKSSKSKIQERLSDIPKKDIQKRLYAMVRKRELSTEGAKKNRVYLLSKKNK